MNAYPYAQNGLTPSTRARRALTILLVSFAGFFLTAAASHAGLEITDVTPSGSVTLPSGQQQCIDIKYRYASADTPFAENAKMTVTIPSSFAGNAVGDFNVSGSVHAPAASFNSSTRKLTWDYIPQLSAGSSGTLSFCVTFPAGTTPDGTIASISPQFTADNQTLGTFNDPPEFTSDANPQLTTSKTLVAGGAIDGEAIYQLTVTNPAIGSIDVTGVTLTDTLVDGSVYKESIPSGAFTDNTSPTQDIVTWNLGDIAAGSSQSVYIRVEYPDSAFDEDDVVTNSASAQGTLVTTSQLYQTPSGSDPHGLGPASPGLTRNKGLFSDTPALGYTPTRYSVSIDNTGTAALTNVVVEDSLPKEFFPSSIDLGYDTAFGSTLSNVVVEIKTTASSTYAAVTGSPFTLTDSSVSIPFTGDTVTHIRVTYPNIGVGFASSNALVVHGVFGEDDGNGWYEDRNGDAIPTVSDQGLTDYVVDDGDVDTVPVSNLLDVSYTHNGETTDLNQLSADYTLRENRPRPTLGKSFSEVIDGFSGQAGGNGNIEPLDVLEYTITLSNASGATEVLSDPEFVDLLPDTLDFEEGSVMVVSSGGLTGPNGTVQVTDDHNGSGQTLLRFDFTGDLAVGDSVSVKFRAMIKPGVAVDTVGPNAADLIDFSNGPMHVESCTFTGTPPSYDTDDNSGTAAIPAICGSPGANYTVAQLAAIESEKLVLGEFDTVFSKFPNIGSTPPGGTFDYKLSLNNPGNVPATNIRLIDIFPYIGDTGVVDAATARQSEWAPFLEDFIPESGVLTITRYNATTETYSTETGSIEVEYSTETNPCRPELFGGANEPSGCSAPNWVSSLTDYATARSIRITFKDAANNALTLNPLESIEFGWTMRAPDTAMPDEVAWNTFGFVSDNANDDSEIPPTEPIKVGVRIDAVSVGNLVWIDSTAGMPVTEDNGLLDSGENPLENAQVEIFQYVDGELEPSPAKSALTITAGAGPAIDPVFTDSNGIYEFTGLMPSGTEYNGVTYGDFVVRVTPPSGLANQYVPGSDMAEYYEADPNITVDSDNNGIDTGSGNVLESGPITLTLDIEPTSDGQTSGDDADGNMTVDFAFVANQAGTQLANLGNVVWFDTDADGTKGGSETAIENATVTLYDSNGQTVKDAHGNDVDPILTDENGLYNFIDLLPGKYIVKVTPPAPPAGAAPYEATPSTGANDDDNHGTESPGANGDIMPGDIVSPEVTLAAGDTDNTIDFGLIRPLSLGDLVWIDGSSGDVNAGNGTQDSVGSPGEAPLPNATVELFTTTGGTVTDLDGNTVTSTTTNSAGLYSFTNLLPGDYIVRVTPPTHYEITDNTNGGVNPDFDPDDNDNTDSNAGVQSGINGGIADGDIVSLPVTLAMDAETADGDSNPDNNPSVDFGFIPVPGDVVRLGDRVWFDRNGNGIQDSGEPNIEGATVELFDENGQPVTDAYLDPVTAQTTGTDGLYNFPDLLPGNYIVKVTPPSGQGYFLTPVNSTDTADGAPGNDSNGTVQSGSNGNIADSDIVSPIVMLAAGEDDPKIDFGFTQTVSVGNYVWIDSSAANPGTTKDGLQDSYENAFPNATVWLLVDTGSGTYVQATDANGATVASTTTDSDGLYSFGNLLPGNYVVALEEPDFYDPSPFANANNDPNDETTGFDTDNNGSATLLSTDTGNPTGADLIISGPVTLHAALEPTLDDGEDAAFGSPDINGNGAVDFGVVPEIVDMRDDVSLGDFVWLDENRDGIQDGTENGIAGAVVELLDSSGNPALDADLNPVPSQTTGTNGFYEFDNLLPGDYIVRVTPPTDHAIVKIGGDDPDTDTDTDDNNGTQVNGQPYAQTTVVTLDPGEMDPKVDFGLVELVSIGNYLWFDLNANGVQDLTEEGVEDADVALLMESAPGSGTYIAATDAYGNAITAQTTGTDGLYSFGDLYPGNYKVRVTPPTGMILTPHGGGDPDTVLSDSDNNGIAVTGESYVESAPVTLEANDEPTGDGGTPDDNNGDYTVDFGFIEPVSLGNYVWWDRDGNGTQDGTETGLAGATVTLIDNATGLRAKDKDGNDVDDVTTGTDGAYNFTGLLPGNYVVRVQAPGDFILTAGTGTDPQTDNNGSEVTNETYVESGVVTLGVRAQTDDGNNDDNNDPTIDFGFLETVSLGDYVWLDLNGDGLQDSENGLDGATVELFLADGTTPATDYQGNTVPSQTTTGGTGFYEFTDLLEGDYVVRVTPPLNHLLTPHGGDDPDSDASNNDNNGNPVSGQTYVQSLPVTLTVDAEPTGDGGGDPDDNNGNRTVDFGFVQTVSIGSIIFEDTDKDGSLATEPPLENAVVELLVDNGAGTLVQATDVDGDPVASITTDNTGVYEFNDLYPGDYVVRVTPPAGYAATPVNENDPNGTPLDTDSNGQPVPGESYAQSVPVSLTIDGEPTGEGTSSFGKDENGNGTIDFGFIQTVSLGDYVWLDADVDGAQGGTEEGIENATVSLWVDDGNGGLEQATDASGAPVAPVSTDEFGAYAFTNLFEDDYVVRVEPPAGYLLTPGTGGTAQTDNNGQPVTNETYVQSAPVTLTIGGETGDGDSNDNNDPTIDFGFYRPVSLGNFVWFDRDGDGEQGGSESGLAGATVTLIDNATGLRAEDKDGNDVADVTTTGTGAYNFTDLLPGNYVVRVEPPANYLLTGGTGGTSQTDNNGTQVGPNVESGVVNLASNAETGDGDGDPDNDPTIDFGFVQLVSLGNYVWLDVDGDGAQDGEDGLDGATVSLWVDDGNGGLEQATDYTGTAVPDQTTSGGTGFYEFTGLLEGDYVVRVQPPADHVRTPHGGDDPDGDDSNNDNNGNDVTNETYVQSPPVTLTLGLEPLVDGTSNNPVDGNGNMTVDFGFVQLVSLGSLIFEDTNNDGSLTGEPPLENATVELLVDNGTGTLVQATDASGNPVAPIVTDNTGVYNFTGLYPGDYVVRVTPPAGYNATPVNGGDPDGNPDDTDSNALPQSGQAYVLSTPVTLTVLGETGDGDTDDNNNPSIDFGFVTKVSVGDYVWFDADLDGEQGGTESPLAGATVELVDNNGDPVTDIYGNTVASQTTGSNGLYQFDDLPEGAYKVRVTPPAGYVLTPGNGGTSQTDNNGIDVGQAYVESGTVNLAVGAETGDGDSDDNNDPTVDFGFVPSLTLGDYVWLDINRDGLQAGENGLPGATVELFQADGTTPAMDLYGSPVPLQTTGSGGSYLFTDLAPGEYVVRVTPPAGDILTNEGADPDSDDANNDNNGQSVSGQEYVASTPVTLAFNTEPITDGDTDDNSNLSVDFGFYDPTPETYEEFQNTPGASGTPDGNTDGDLYPDPVEYALGMDPSTGVPSNQGFCALEVDPTLNYIDAFFTRPEGILDATYTFEGASSLTGPFTPLATLAPGQPVPSGVTVTSNGDGTEEVRYARIDEVAPLTETFGIVRLRIEVDTTGDTLPDTLDYAPLFGWERTSYAANECVTAGWPMTNKAAFSGVIDDVTGDVLDFSTAANGFDLGSLIADGSYYIEVIADPDGATGGDWEGHRFDVASAGVDAMTLVNDGDIFDPATPSHNTQNGAPPAGLAGTSIALKKHYTLDDLLDKVNAFSGSPGGPSDPDPDRLLRYDNRAASPGFQAYVLIDNGSVVKWIEESDIIGQVDQGGIIMDPLEGYFIHPRIATVDYLRIGMLREHDVATPFPADYTLLGSAYLIDQSPAGTDGVGRGMTAARGIPGGIDPYQASEILIWEGDEGSYVESYLDYFLLDHTAPWQFWTNWADLSLPNLDSSVIFRSGRASFVQLPVGTHAIDFVQPLPTNP